MVMIDRYYLLAVIFFTGRDFIQVQLKTRIKVRVCVLLNSTLDGFSLYPFTQPYRVEPVVLYGISTSDKLSYLLSFADSIHHHHSTCNELIALKHTHAVACNSLFPRALIRLVVVAH